MPEVHVQELFSNPIAPPDHEGASAGPPDKRSINNLTNDDFRKLLTTPRASGSGSGGVASADPAPSPFTQEKTLRHGGRRDKKRKSGYISKLKLEDEERQAEWAKIYRDRAKERREDKPGEFSTDQGVGATSGYKAVAPDINPIVLAEQRKQVIQQSKFLGGDMEHTHLVKGLDYALLQKVRSELHSHEQLEEEQMEMERSKREREKAQVEIEEDMKFKTKMAKGVFRAAFLTKPPERNEVFLPGRMAYVYELDDEYAESDIPTTLMRSKADCPTLEVQTTLSTNDIVINKLTQILSYLRQGARAGKKGKKRGKGHEAEHYGKPTGTASYDRIFEDAGDYVFDPKAPGAALPPSSGPAVKPGAAAKPGGAAKPGAAAKPRAASASAGYFDRLEGEEKESVEDIRRTAEDFVRSVGKKFSGKDVSSDEADKLAAGWAPADFSWLQDQAPEAPAAPAADAREAATGGPEPPGSARKTAGFGGFSAQEHYAECYPGAMEEYDATYDSDEDTDFTKMDMGNKKGPIKRWDFDNEDDYSSYQSHREALPKAAFQFGVKMSEGRKTRRFGGAQGQEKEKAKLNREWQKISALIDKRKSKGSDGGSAPKRPKLD